MPERFVYLRGTRYRIKIDIPHGVNAEARIQTLIKMGELPPGATLDSPNYKRPKLPSGSR